MTAFKFVLDLSLMLLTCWIVMGFLVPICSRVLGVAESVTSGVRLISNGVIAGLCVAIAIADSGLHGGLTATLIAFVACVVGAVGLAQGKAAAEHIESSHLDEVVAERGTVAMLAVPVLVALGALLTAVAASVLVAVAQV